jgi:uncharacterized membrane protein YfcA
MEIAIISITAFATAIMTFFSGFGLGTILTPVFMLFFPVELAIALTGIVHFFNNIFKVILVGRDANKEVLIRFGIPAVIAAFLGSLVLLNISNSVPIFSYVAFGSQYEVFPIKLLVSVLLILFATMDLIPYFNNLKFGKDKLIIGGLLSGFFGGLSGNQGALRSAFLIKIGLSKEAFVGTAVVVSTFVDFTRLGVYATHFEESGLFNNLELVIWATLSAFAGAFLGNKLLKKVTLGFLQIVTAILLIIIALGLGLGVL